MALPIIHRVDKAIYQLLNAPKDIEGGTPVSDYEGNVDGAHKRLRDLFSAYYEGYQFLYPHAERWWRGLIASEEKEGRSEREVLEAAFEQTLAGPASVPEFIWFIRHFWLKCDEINKALPGKQRVAPQIVLLKWLVDAGETEYVALLTSMPYWPIGLDAQGEWC